MKDKILELVVYRIKPNQIKQYQTETLNKIRELIKNFQGMLNYATYYSVAEEGLFVDQVEWENLECAEFAAARIKELQREEPFSNYLSAFEEVIMFHHLKHVS